MGNKTRSVRELKPAQFRLAAQASNPGVRGPGNTGISLLRAASTTTLLGGSALRRAHWNPVGAVQKVAAPKCYLCLVAAAPRFLCLPALLLQPSLALLTSAVLHISVVGLLVSASPAVLQKGVWLYPELAFEAHQSCYRELPCSMYANAFFFCGALLFGFPFSSDDLVLLRQLGDHFAFKPWCL